MSQLSQNFKSYLCGTKLLQPPAVPLGQALVRRYTSRNESGVHAKWPTSSVAAWFSTPPISGRGSHDFQQERWFMIRVTLLSNTQEIRAHRLRSQIGVIGR